VQAVSIGPERLIYPPYPALAPPVPSPFATEIGDPRTVGVRRHPLGLVYRLYVGPSAEV